VEIRDRGGAVWSPRDTTPPSNQPMTLRDGLVQSRNSITAQVVQRIGPQKVAELAYNLGVRESKLEMVPSLALGTSPVTLREMVTAYGTLANNGRYLGDPQLIARVEDRNGRTLVLFTRPKAMEVMPRPQALQLVNVMRGVVDEGTGAAIRSRYGIQADVAGKTGTTQDNTDGWFVLMHPQLVAGAWMGFNDNRVTMRSGYWGQGAHNALFVVGDFMQQSVRSGLVDSKAAFAAPRLQDQQPLLERMGDWWNSVFTTPAAPDPTVAAVPETQLPDASLQPPVLEPPPGSVGAPGAMPAPIPGPAVTPNAPVIVEPQRVPAFPRPLESARPVETVPGTQVYRAPDTAVSGAAREAAPVIAPAPVPAPAPRESAAPPRDTVLVPRQITIAPRDGGSAVVRDITVSPREVTAPAGSPSASGSSAASVPAASGDAGGGGSPPAE
jgi:penicillin-binding protein 1A